MKKINKIIERKNRKINYLETEQIARPQILESPRSRILEGNEVKKPQILDADEVQKSGNLGPGFWKDLDKLIFMILYSIKLEVRSHILEGIGGRIYTW